MKKIELWLNIVHYCLYKADCKRHHLTNKVNPFVLLGRIPRVRRNLEEQGTTLLEVTDRIWTDKRYGFSITISGGGVVVFVAFLLWGLISTLFGFFEIYFFIKPAYVFLYAVVSFIICHLAVFKKDKYILYFKKLDKQPKNKKWEYVLFTLLFVIGSIVLWIYSFRFSPSYP